MRGLPPGALPVPADNTGAKPRATLRDRNLRGWPRVEAGLVPPDARQNTRRRRGDQQFDARWPWRRSGRVRRLENTSGFGRQRRRIDETPDVAVGPERYAPASPRFVDQSQGYASARDLDSSAGASSGKPPARSSLAIRSAIGLRHRRGGGRVGLRCGGLGPQGGERCSRAPRGRSAAGRPHEALHRQPAAWSTNLTSDPATRSLPPASAGADVEHREQSCRPSPIWRASTNSAFRRGGRAGRRRKPLRRRASAAARVRLGHHRLHALDEGAPARGHLEGVEVALAIEMPSASACFCPIRCRI